MSGYQTVAAESTSRDEARTISRVFFVCAMLFMPISTGAARGVFAMGLPFLAVLSIHYLMMQTINPVMEVWQRRTALYAFLLIAAIGISTIYSIAPFASFARLVPNVLGFFLFLLLISPFFGPQSSRATYEFTAKVYVFAGGLVALYYLVNFAFAVSTIGIAAVFLDRVTGGVISLPWGATNVVASVLLFPFFLTFYFTNRQAASGGRFRYLLVRVVMIAAITATVSRGAILSIVIGMIVLGALLHGKEKRRMLFFLAVAAAAIFYANQQLNEVMSQQGVSTLLNRFQDSDMRDMNGRLFIWEKFGSAFIESPIFGIGYYSSLYYFQTSGHNLLLTSLVERGILGFALSAALPIKAAETLSFGLSEAADVQTRLIFCCMSAGAVASLTHLMIEDANFTQQYIIYSWVALALVFQAAQVIRNQGNRPENVPAGLPLSLQT